MSEALRSQSLKRVKMRLFTAVVIVFTLACSGAFGMEDVVSSSGPGFTLLLLIVIPLVWSLPMGLVAAELGSMIPEGGGFYRWVRRALGEYWSFMTGWWYSMSLYVDSTVYVALGVTYAQNVWGFSDFWRWVIAAVLIAIFTFINMRGLELTGIALIIIQAVVLIPFGIFIAIGLARGTGAPVTPFLPPGQSAFASLGLGLAVLMWMYAGYEGMSTIAAEVENPQRIIPRAILIAMPITILVYVLSTAAGIRAAGAGQWLNMGSDASTGAIDFIAASKIVSGAFLGYLMLASAIASNIGLYTGFMATGARPMYQMSRDRLLPRFWGKVHKSWGTPWVSIGIMGIVNIVLVGYGFTTLIVIDVFLLMFSYIPIFITAIVLRYKEPDTPRPFRVPLPTWALALYLLLPTGIAVLALFTNGADYLVGGMIGVLSGPIAYLIFKRVYGGTSDRALEGSAVTPEGELTAFGAEIEGVQA